MGFESVSADQRYEFIARTVRRSDYGRPKRADKKQSGSRWQQSALQAAPRAALNRKMAAIEDQRPAGR